jgi:hypothetical protein
MILAFSCKKDDDDFINKYVINGFVQKGPFIQGSEVRIQELTSDLIANGNSYFTETNDDFGSFNSNSEILEGYIDIATTGFYFNEVEGKLSNSFITLKGISFLNETKVFNINILTTLSYNRIKYLIKNGKYSFADARNKAQKEILNSFHINIPDSLIGSFEEMDISKNGLNNSILLAITSILQFNNTEAELSELVTKISDDIEIDGILNSQNFVSVIRENSMNLNAKSISDNLSKRYSDLGLNITIPDFAKYVDSDGDGVININETENPMFSLPSGIYLTDTIVEIIVATQNAIIYYTLDGSEPDSTSLIYENPISIKGDNTQVTIKAVAKNIDLDISQIISANYSIQYPIIMPDFNLASGEHNKDVEIVLTANINNAKIYYTTDNSTPDINSTLYETPIELKGDGNSINVSAIAIKNGFRSQILSNTYTINYSPAQPATFSKMAGTYNSDIDIVISSLTQNSVIYYTTDGTEPTESSNIYSTPLSIKNNGTKIYLKAIAKSEQTKFSSLASVYYSIDYSYDSDLFNSLLSISEYQSEIVGKWIGYRTCPWTSPINVEVTFNSNGTYTSKSLTPGHVAFYYGSDTETNSYSIYDLNADDSAKGDIGRFSDSNTGGLKFIKFSENLNVLSFEFWHRNQYGPLKYVLTRAE